MRPAPTVRGRRTAVGAALGPLPAGKIDSSRRLRWQRTATSAARYAHLQPTTLAAEIGEPIHPYHGSDGTPFKPSATSHWSNATPFRDPTDKRRQDYRQSARNRAPLPPVSWLRKPWKVVKWRGNGVRFSSRFGHRRWLDFEIRAARAPTTGSHLRAHPRQPCSKLGPISLSRPLPVTFLPVSPRFLTSWRQ